MKWDFNAADSNYRIIYFIIGGAKSFSYRFSLTSIIPQSISNSIQIGDINNDGYNDIIYSGYDSTRFGLFVDVLTGNTEGTLSINYQTNFPTYPDTIAEYLGGLGNISLVDVNLDGYIDMYVNGSAKSKLLMNVSGNSFNESSMIDNMSITYSHGKWSDVNMDGKPDLFLMGVNEYSDNILNELFKSRHNLEEDPLLFSLPYLQVAIHGVDYDNDGDPDLIILGQTADPNSSVSRLYQNDPVGRLTEVTTASAIKGLKAGASHFADLILMVI